MSWNSWFFAVILGLSVAALAARAELSDEQKAREDEISQRAKQRQYPGGSDESDLKVQNPLPAPVRKVAPAVEDDGSSEPETAGQD